MPPDLAVPASASNLGPGFDALAVALQLYLTVRIVDVSRGDGGSLDCEFLDRPPRGENRIARAFEIACARHGRPRDGLRIVVQSDIPQRAGLGSSAAATVAGLRLYDLAAQRQPGASDWLALAAEIEGHPDNAAAAIHGGLTMSCQTDDGRVLAGSWPWPDAVQLVVATPAHEVDTTEARRILPRAIPLADAVFNLQHTLLFVHALQSGQFDRLREAMRDRWHQSPRLAMVPGLREMLALEHPALLAVALSGSGPSVVALTQSPSEIGPVLDAVYGRAGVACTLRTLAVHQPSAAMPLLHGIG